MRNAFDIFSNFFGGPGGRGGMGREQRVQRGPDAQTFTECSLIDAYRGGILDLQLNMQGVCDECDGTGSADGQEHICSACQGHGIRIVRHQLAPGMIQQMQTTCDVCRGKGKVISQPCSVCKGDRVIREDRNYHVVIEPGVGKFFDHVIPGESDQSPDWDAGDLIIHIKESRENNMGYRRRGRDLFRKEVLSLKEATNGGWNRTVKFLDDSDIKLSRKEGISVTTGEVQIIKNKGMPVLHEPGKFGDLYIEYIVILPGKITTPEASHDDL
ncbi:Scj1p [Sugiyamaella lignohabitans]|uniref:Scj1p n=1 Tax=Sugiyamaella lignohabitans TaxID=796027 RepID=A0A161HN61_9ASCO|nr:Scj1p [Sugiyamaella lignohabitans]ANB15497.1 Scj1p [Sugiyamaella lignohabitans]